MKRFIKCCLADEFSTNEMKRILIKSDPKIMMGKPVIAGTRITVELILEKLSNGESIQQILKEHPQLDKKAIFAALDFAIWQQGSS